MTQKTRRCTSPAGCGGCRCCRSQIPSPMLWLALTHQLAGAGDVADLSVDDAENAAMHVAGWLRRLSMLPISDPLAYALAGTDPPAGRRRRCRRPERR